MTRLLTIPAIVFTLFSCTSSIPEGVVAVQPFYKEKYLGKWFEICRLDYKYERHLSNVTATYSLNDNGSIKVENRGYNEMEKEWKQTVGKAKFVKDENIGMLKVSFFGPIYSGYNIIAVDKYYKYALVAGESLRYLWILSRDTTMPENVKNEYLQLANKIGYDTSKLVWVKHDKHSL